MFDEMVDEGRLGAQKFVALTATAPARLFSLTGKGLIEVRADADIAIWNPRQSVTFAVNDMHDGTGCNPFAGHTVTGWPKTVLSRGEVVLSNAQSFALA